MERCRCVPPKGVYGCGALTMERPGVKIWPLMVVKVRWPFWARATAGRRESRERVEKCILKGEACAAGLLCR